MRRERRADSLRQALSVAGAKSAARLREIDQQFQTLDGYLDDVLDLVADRDMAIVAGATWLLRAELARGGSMTATRCRQLTRAALDVRDWSAALHLCQSIRYLQFDLSSARRLAPWLTSWTTHERPFLRAWSVDALVSLASAHAELRGAALKALQRAHEDEAASVRARARALAAVAG